MAEKVEIAGPGFINIFLNKQWLAARAEEALNDDRLSVAKEKEQTIVVDYSAPKRSKRNARRSPTFNYHR